MFRPLLVSLFIFLSGCSIPQQVVVKQVHLSYSYDEHTISTSFQLENNSEKF